MVKNLVFHTSLITLKKSNRQLKTTLLLIVFVVELFIGIALPFAAAIPKNNSKQSRLSHLSGPNTDHSSPYYFPVAADSPLMMLNNKDEFSNDEISPQTSQYAGQTLYTLNMHMSKYALLQSEPVMVYFTHYTNFTRSPNREITVQVWKGYYRYYYSYYSNYYDSERVFQTSIQTNAEGEATLTIPSSYLTAQSLYTISAQSGSEYNYLEFSVGDIGIYFKGPVYSKPGHEYIGSLHLLNISAFTPLSYNSYTFDLSTLVYSNNNYIWQNIQNGSGQVDGFGYDELSVILPLALNSDSWWSNQYRLRIFAENGTSLVKFETYIYESWDWYYYSLRGGKQETNEDRYQFIVTTDKTIYSPGETVQLRALVMNYNYLNTTKTPITNESVQLTLYNPDELAVYWSSLQTNMYGVLEYSIPFDNDAKIGSWSIEFNFHGYTYRYVIKLAHYTKPVFRVEIDTDGRDFYPLKRTLGIKNSPKFMGDIVTTYYFGQAVIDAEVNFRIKDYSDTTQLEIKGKTNGEGRYSFIIDLDALSNIDYAFTVIVTVTDNYGRVASAEKRYTRMEELYVYGYVTDWAPLINKPIDYYFSAYQLLPNEDYYYSWGYDFNPLQNVSASIKIYGLRNYPLYITKITNKEYIKSYSGFTNSFGSGLISIELSQSLLFPYHFFEVELTITLADGRTATSSSYFRYRRYDLNLTLQSTRINPGDSIMFTASYKDVLTGLPMLGEGYVYLYDSDYQMVAQANLQLTGEQEYVLKLPTMAPTGQYYLSSYVNSRANSFFGGFEYHSAFISFDVGLLQQFTLNTNASIDSPYGYRSVIEYGNYLRIWGSTSYSSNLPVYLGIYKRGLTALYPLTLVNNNYELILPMTDLYVPQITIQLYTITSQGRVLEISHVIEVKQNWNFTLTTDKSIYEPGDTVTLTISPNFEQEMVTAISFIDSAVLDVEPEDDSELAYFQPTQYWSYIQSGSSWGQGIAWGYYWWSNYRTFGGIFTTYTSRQDDKVYEMADSPNAIQDKTGGAVSISPPSFKDLLHNFDVEIRKNITESANWQPIRIISGPTNITFKLPDNIGEWTIRVVGSWGSTGDVQIIPIKTFLPFFVEFEAPSPIKQDDIVGVKAYVYNYLSGDVDAYVSIDSSTLKILNLATQLVRVPQNFVAEVEFTMLASVPFEHNLTILAATTLDSVPYSDGRQEKIYIAPSGIEKYEIQRGSLNTSEISKILNNTIQNGSIYSRTTLNVYSRLWDTALVGWHSLIGYPYGCIEQTMSKLLPTALVYRYLNETDQLTPELTFQLENMITSGLIRIYSLQYSTGAWGWWEEDTANIQMTALVLYGLTQVQDAGFFINPHVIANAKSFLINQINLSTLNWYQNYSGLSQNELNLFVSRALIATNNLSSSESAFVLSVLEKFRFNWNRNNSRSIYAAELYFDGTFGTIFVNATFNAQLIDYILEHRSIQSTGSYWQGGSQWYNLGGGTELTALALSMLAKTDFISHVSVIQSGISYLLSQRNRYGWQNTADTSAAISTLILLDSLAGSIKMIDFNGTLQLYNQNFSSLIHILNFSDTTFNLPSQLRIDLTSHTRIGENNFNLSLIGNGGLYYSLETYQLLRPSPQIVLPEVINVGLNQSFILPLHVRNLPNSVGLTNITISLLGVSPSIRSQFSTKIFSYDQLSEGIQYGIELISPSSPGVYFIGQVSVNGKFVDRGATEKNPYSITFRQDIGPILVIVDANNPVNANPFSSQKYVFGNPIFSEHNQAGLSGLKRPQLSNTAALSLQKSIPESVSPISGAILPIQITINNPGNILSYYMLEDPLPTGSDIVANSISVFGATDYTIQSTSSHLILYFPTIPQGQILISYKIQLYAAKNVLGDSAKLWGMYDTTEVYSTQFLYTPLMHLIYPNHTLFQDLWIPSYRGLIAKQIDGQGVRVKIELNAADETMIGKIRVIYRQTTVWRAKIVPLYLESGDFVLVLDSLANIDSQLDYYIEVWDIYGNILTSPIKILQLRSTIIPIFMTLFIILGAVGLAGSAMHYVKRKRISIQKESPFQAELTTCVNFIEPEESNNEKS
jgi:hypothetical protein